MVAVRRISSLFHDSTTIVPEISSTRYGHFSSGVTLGKLLLRCNIERQRRQCEEGANCKEPGAN